MTERNPKLVQLLKEALEKTIAMEEEAAKEKVREFIAEAMRERFHRLIEQENEEDFDKEMEEVDQEDLYDKLDDVKAHIDKVKDEILAAIYGEDEESPEDEEAQEQESAEDEEPVNDEFEQDQDEYEEGFGETEEENNKEDEEEDLEEAMKSMYEDYDEEDLNDILMKLNDKMPSDERMNHRDKKERKISEQAHDRIHQKNKSVKVEENEIESTIEEIITKLREKDEENKNEKDNEFVDEDISEDDLLKEIEAFLEKTENEESDVEEDEVNSDEMTPEEIEKALEDLDLKEVDEAIEEILSKVSFTPTEGEVGVGKKKAVGNTSSPIPQHPADERMHRASAPQVKYTPVKDYEWDKPTIPVMPTAKKGTNVTTKGSKVYHNIPKGGDANALLNQKEFNVPGNTKSPISGRKR